VNRLPESGTIELVGSIGVFPDTGFFRGNNDPRNKGCPLIAHWMDNILSFFLKKYFTRNWFPSILDK
jgi:hypothetical protein